MTDNISTEWHAVDAAGSKLVCRINFSATAVRPNQQTNLPSAMQVQLEIGGRFIQFRLADVEQNSKRSESTSALHSDESFFRIKPQEVQLNSSVDCLVFFFNVGCNG